MNLNVDEKDIAALVASSQQTLAKADEVLARLIVTLDNLNSILAAVRAIKLQEPPNCP